MNRKPALLWILACCLSAGSLGVYARAQNNPGKDSQSKQQQKSKTPSTDSNHQSPKEKQPATTQPNGNPFPEDVNSVPVMPSADAPDTPDFGAEANSPDAAPPKDSDPVRSPEEMGPSDNGATEGFSSSSSGLDNIVPPPDTDTKGQPADVIPKETPAKDIDVGNFYMDNKNWRGALSRFQSAMVLAPDNPDVYWGLAECYRHLGQFAEARANYEKVASYDPDSKHGKEAQKALKDPQIAGAKK